MYNHTGLQGRLTADPELRHTPSGVAITSFRLASDTGRKTKDGQKITNFIDCPGGPLSPPPRPPRVNARWCTNGGSCLCHPRGGARGPTENEPKTRDRIEGGDDRGMASSAPNTQRPPQAL